MSEYDNSGLIFRDEGKQSEKDRDYRGSCTIAGKEYWISGWVKEGRKGKFLSLSFKFKEPKKPLAGASSPAAKPAAATAPSGRTADVEPDDIPF